ncbi:MAG: hypothetical protein ABSH35_36785 [Isosphaeraceae bacterium]|jgi:hypothetical protein
MSGGMKPNRKYQDMYAIIRYETDADINAPIDLRITVKKVVVDPHYAEKEVKRLNELNKDKGSYYFCQVTRFEDAPVEVQALAPMQLTATDES